MNSRHNVAVFILAILIITTATFYFILAQNEYENLIEFAAEGLVGEIPELQIEVVLFAGSGIVYLGILGWILLKRLKSILPYTTLIIVSLVLIITYAASRTVGVPIIGVEFYIGKYDMITKVLQGIIIAVSGYLLYEIKKGSSSRQEETIKK
jgi:hypothetical protein